MRVITNLLLTLLLLPLQVTAARAQALPPSIGPGSLQQRLLGQDAPRGIGPLIRQDIDCNDQEEIPQAQFELRGIMVDQAIAELAYESHADRWEGLLNSIVTLVQFCATAREIAVDYRRRTGREVSVILPAQAILDGIVSLRFQVPAASE